MPRAISIEVVLLGLLGLGACAPLPEEPKLGGPASASNATGPASDGAKAESPGSTRELVWVKGRTVIEVTASDRMCKEGGALQACVYLSKADRQKLDAFFGDATFRTRWTSYKPCLAPIGAETEAFGVTFRDGEKVSKVLDLPIMNNPRGPCDTSMRDAVVGIRDDLMSRYFR